MAIINRFTQLFTADLHAVLDRIEEPGALLRQAIRDMDDDLVILRTELRRRERTCERLRSQRAATESRIKEFDAQLDLCFSSADASSARPIVKKKLEVARMLQGIVSSLASAESELDDRARQIAAFEDDLVAMRQKLELMCDDTSPEHPPTTPVWEGAIDENEIDIALLREKQRRDIA